MSDKSRSCPKCHTAMDFRLGEFNCPNCGHTELAAQPKQERQSSGPGIRGEQQWGGGQAIPPSVPPPPDTPGVTWGQPRSGAHLEPSAQFSPQGGSVDSLIIEKYIYFAIHLVAGIIFTIMAAFGIANFMPFPGGTLTAVIVGLIFAEAIQLGIIWFVLFGSAIWSKWCCGGCAVIGVLGGLGTALGISNAAQASSGPGDAIIGTLQLAMNIWLITILWRDIQQQNSY